MAKALTVIEQLTKAFASVQYTAKRKTNSGVLFDIRKWQEAKSMAEKNLKQAWADAQAEGLVTTDDDMRALGEGTHVVTESGPFSVTAKVSTARSSIDADLLLSAIVSHFKCTPLVALNVIERGKKEGKPALEKRVLEVE
jgi:hypothetical protein